MLITFNSSETLAIFSGPKDQHLKFLEKSLNVKIKRKTEGLEVKGADVDLELLQSLCQQTQEIIKNNQLLDLSDIERALKILSADRFANLTDCCVQGIKLGGQNTSVFPKTPNQKKYLEAIHSKDIVFGIGPAGTGKTYLAMAEALSALLSKQVKRIVLTRPAVEAGEKLGFLPGDLAEKVNPYLRPLYDALFDIMGYEDGQNLIDKGQIEVAPVAFMRGRTLSNAFVILDESQNTDSKQMKMLLTRIGKGSKCLITGDITQVDLPRGTTSGLVEALRVLKDIQDIGMVYFGEQDVIRHKLVTDIIQAYAKHEH